MLQRVAMHQTRLRVPGLGIDGKGVVLGARGLVLLASVERLVAFLSLYTSERSLGDIIASLKIEVVRSKMGTREVLLSMSATNSEFMDHVAEVARLALGHSFTGSARHFVQFRDSAAPFGYDASEVIASDADYVLYHSMYTQAYARERDIDLSRLLLRLRPHLDPSTARDVGDIWVLAEEGTGPAWIQYLIRSRVDAQVGLAEWPPASSLDEGPVRRYLFHVPELPSRMLPLVRTTPGLSAFRKMAPGVAVEIGFRHPVNLQACPVFPDSGLVLFRGSSEEPVILERLPALGEVTSFARVSFNGSTQIATAQLVDAATVRQVAVPVRLAPSLEGFRSVRATFIRTSEYPLLRRVLYGLGRQTLTDAKIAFTRIGAMLVHAAGVESIPVGTFLRELRPGLYVAAGYDPVPAIDPEVLHRTLGSPTDQHVVLLPEQPPIGFATSSFVRLQDALVEGQAWSPIDPIELEAVLQTEVPRLQFEALGMRPMADVSSVVPGSEEGADGSG
ncbi:MAG: hypothetical protein HY898_27595 [Deltaproteobacteria bacterium]|nr:hypothetical protein [Deltaproteobacteria bacterium]